MKDNKEIFFLNRKIQSKNIKIVYNSLCVCVCVCGLYLYIIVSGRISDV